MIKIINRRRIVRKFRRGIRRMMPVASVVVAVGCVWGICHIIMSTNDNIVINEGMSTNTYKASDEKVDNDKSYTIDNVFKDEKPSFKIDESDETGKQVAQLLEQYPRVVNILENREEYPDELLNSLINNQETLDFVLDYPQKHSVSTDIGALTLPDDNSIPLYIQWDERWGYLSYGNNIIGVSGCGPTSLAMVAGALLNDGTINPYTVAKMSEEMGFCTEVGTDWRLMSEGAARLGLKSENIPLSEGTVKNALLDGKPIICSMRPGDFTTTGHFIVLTDWENGYVTVNDPNSNEKSEKKWRYSEIEWQIKNLWAFSKQ